MAEVTRVWFVRHLRSEASHHVVHHVRGHRVRSGRGMSFWFLPMSASVAEVPVDDRELPFVFRGMTRDFQPVVVQGGITWRVADPERLADRVNFTVDLRNGAWVSQPLEQVGGIVTELAQQVANSYLGETELASALAVGVDTLRERITAALGADPSLGGMGVAVASVRVAAVRADAEVERALQTPVREQIQREADKATFERRAHAVEHERAIAENELRNKIELAKREEALIAQKGTNEQRRQREEALSLKIQAEAEAERSTLKAHTEAASIREIELARVDGERGKVDVYRDLAPQVLLGLAARELAGQLPSIEHLTLAPDLLGPALARLAHGTE